MFVQQLADNGLSILVGSGWERVPGCLTQQTASSLTYHQICTAASVNARLDNLIAISGLDSVEGVCKIGHGSTSFVLRPWATNNVQQTSPPVSWDIPAWGLIVRYVWLK
ncbi:hypothetical protein CBL_11444 [Carabus blaptoides fortunei]